MQYSHHFRTSSTNSPRFSKFSVTLCFAELRRIAERCCRKRGVKFSVVFVTVCFRIVLSVFSKKAESNFAFLVKAQSWTNTAYLEKRQNYAFSANMWSETKRYSRKSYFVRELYTYLIFFFILDLSLVYYRMMPKKWEKLTTKSRACGPLKGGGCLCCKYFLGLVCFIFY